MGKAKQKLMDARKACFDNMETDNSSHVVIKEEECLDEYDDIEKNEMYLLDTSIMLRKRLIEYADEGSYPLCEYLDIDNVEIYLEWLLTQ